MLGRLAGREVLGRLLGREVLPFAGNDPLARRPATEALAGIVAREGLPALDLVLDLSLRKELLFLGGVLEPVWNLLPWPLREAIFLSPGRPALAPPLFVLNLLAVRVAAFDFWTFLGRGLAFGVTTLFLVT